MHRSDGRAPKLLEIGARDEKGLAAGRQRPFLPTAMAAERRGAPAEDPGLTRIYRGVALASLGTLLFEIALIRVLSFTIWYHFAYVVLSTALLGFGAAGTLLSLKPTIGSTDLGRTLSRTSLGAALTGAGLLVVMSVLPVDPVKILESPRELVVMLLYEVAAAVPFFFSGLAVSLCLRKGAEHVDRVYFWDLLGAGLGCASSVFLMNLLSPPGALCVACAVLAAAAAAFRGRSALALGGSLVLAGLSPFADRMPLTPAASKHLSNHIAVEKMVPVFSKWTALFRTDLVEKRSAGPPITNLHEWGLSRRVDYKAQPMWGFFTHDASAGAPIYDLRRGNLDFLDDHIMRLPYLVSNAAPRVLVIGVGGGRDVVAALRFGASHVTGVELDETTLDVVERRFSYLSNGRFSPPKVDLVAAEGRHFVERSRDKFDVIQLTGVDTLAAQTSGAYVLAENYLYTTEALHSYFAHLTPRGILSFGIGDWDPNEPQAVGRMLLVARQALVEAGFSNPERHIVALSSLHLIAGVLVRLEPFETDEIDRISTQARRLDFMPLLLGGAAAHPLYQSLMRDEGHAHDALLARLPYVIDPVTDDSPFFFRFFRWSSLLRQKDFGPVHTTALGQLVLVILAVTLVVLALVLIVAPMWIFRRRGVALRGPTAGVALYFAALGFGFMTLEISLMQRFVLYLGYPTYALSVVLFALLVSLGFGSYVSRRWVGMESKALPSALAVAALLVAFCRFGLPAVERWTLGAPLAGRIAISLAILAPLGTVLGVFFPLGIRRAATVHVDLVPWAWSINGAASVAASVLAVILAMQWGFGVVWALSLVVYASGVAALLGLAKA